MILAESDVYITVGMEKPCNSPLQGKSSKTRIPALSSVTNQPYTQIENNKRIEMAHNKV